MSESDIKRAYRKAALKWHPDRRDGLTEQDRGLAHQRFQVRSFAFELMAMSNSQCVTVGAWDCNTRRLSTLSLAAAITMQRYLSEGSLMA